jgi:hypothetical protein
MNIEHRTLNVQHRILYTINLKTVLNNTRRNRLRQRIYPLKFCDLRIMHQRNSLLLKKDKA